MLFFLTDLLQPLLRLCPPEAAHELSIRCLEYGLYPKQTHWDDDRLEQTLFGLRFINPVGLAAGYDKDGRVPNQLLGMGFGFVEVGTVTPKPQSGNPQPRLFRIPNDQAVINRMGFNNAGFDALVQREQSREHKGIIGINIGANRNSLRPDEDYIAGIETLNKYADYFTINISSPNTPGLRDLQNPKQLHELLSWLTSTRSAMMSGGHSWRPILVKLSPDILPDELADIISCLKVNAVDGIIISNTTTSRDGMEESAVAGNPGGLSGRPLFMSSTHMLAKIYQLTNGKIPIVGVGGIESPETAIAKLEAGASLIQLYTGLIYNGPGLIQKIKYALLEYMEQNGFSSINQITGRQADLWAQAPEDAIKAL